MWQPIQVSDTEGENIEERLGRGRWSRDKAQKAIHEYEGCKVVINVRTEEGQAYDNDTEEEEEKEKPRKGAPT